MLPCSTRTPATTPINSPASTDRADSHRKLFKIIYLLILCQSATHSRGSRFCATECGFFATDSFFDVGSNLIVLQSSSHTRLIHEQTIRSAVGCTGIGLHSGAPVSMRILPAPSGTGIVFHRIDLDGFAIEAVSRNVARVSYATSLMKKGVLISTTEHLLSAFIGLGIDNAIVELDNLELPILDGSAQPFAEMIRKVGIRKQRRPRKYLKIRREVEMREGNKFIAVYPANSYSVSYSINFPHPLIGKETFQVQLSNGSYLRHIAPARTFGSRQDEQAMRNMGLIRGASSENCIVLTRDGIENGPLRFSDEFVRHKVLDLVGDLALLGQQILGKVVADRAGHAMHTALVSRILRDQTLWEEVTVSSEETATEAGSGVEAAVGAAV
ncbi:MAG TPA: UDP-3-O-acyl-N-acetylglucosamine deacetylase [Candidatus Sulfotelmatobacter sp.]|nr:UDP-3-O-acyl-N-acetylglucosamine deacetylase [Candidatus Sulfotelmatobacter sp.]